VRYRFADCVLDTDCYVLYRSGDAMPLRPKVFQVLTYLLGQHPRVVSKQELAEQVWPDQIVSDTAVEACIKAVRRVVGDSGRIQSVIQTRHGHGYGITASVAQEVSASCQDLLVADAQADIVWPRSDSTCRDVTLHAGERKTVTMLCCALTASPRAEQAVELDVLYRYLNILYDMVADTLDAYGGSLQPPAGQHVLVVFGAPAAQEDHAQRAILTALALRHRWGSYQAAHGDAEANMLGIRMGVYTGTVAVGGINADNKTAMLIVGDSATFAVALQESAEPGAIRCCQATAHAVRSVSYVKAAAPLYIMAQAELLPTYDVLRQRLRRARGALHSAWTQRLLVGREPELNILHRRWTQVQAGRGQVVGIAGEPGIGKSRLIHAFRHRLRGPGLTYLTGRCLSYSHTTPYLPIVDLLRHACGLTEFDAPKVVSWKVQHCLEVVGLDAERDTPYLLSLFGLQTASDDPLTPAPDAFRARTFAILLQLCLQGSSLYPLVLEIEDIHWLDATSEAWLTSLVDRLAEVPILVLTTYRSGYYPSWLAKPYATQVALGGCPRINPSTSSVQSCPMEGERR
jgi:DNA-binding winged helix-turn-helix (wHTH) protein